MRITFNFQVIIDKMDNLLIYFENDFKTDNNIYDKRRTLFYAIHATNDEQHARGAHIIDFLPVTVTIRMYK